VQDVRYQAGAAHKVVFFLMEFIPAFSLIILDVLPIIPLASSEDKDKLPVSTRAKCESI